MGGVRGTRGLILVVTLATALLSPAAAEAAYPGQNGKIAFSRDGQIWTMNADGTGQVQLTSAADPSTEPEWSPNGARIAYTRGTGSQREVRVMNFNGTGDAQVSGPWTYSPSWSPDGSRLAFVAPEFDPIDCACTIYWIVESNLDGTQRRTITAGENDGGGSGDLGPVNDLEWSPRGHEIAFTNGAVDRVVSVTDVATGAKNGIAGELCCYEAFRGAWSPTGGRVAFIRLDFGTSSNELYTMNRDYTGLTHLTGLHPQSVEWSPNGTNLVFAEGADLFKSNVDGTAKTSLASGGETPDWQPFPYTGYARPKGATPIRASLVIAYKACNPTNINRVHGPSLEFSSCAPPVEESDWVTTGTADANGQPTQFVGSLRFDTLAGNLATPADEADLKIVMDITDVRRKDDLTDYVGEVQANTTLRITDRFNAGAPGGGSDPATVVDIPLPVNAGCSATADPTVGSTCATTTTFDAIVPAAVREGKRAIWQIGQLQVYDGGSDGAISTGPNTLFARQGIFVP